MSDKPIQSSSRSVTTTIDADLCIGCGQCVAVCPKETITMEADKAVVTGSESMNCGHCAAVCPTEAVQVAALDPELVRFANFSADNRWLPHGRFDTAALVNLMGSRRSCRNFTDQPVDGTFLEDLVKIGVTAPSGSNCQPWTFTILPNRQAVVALARSVGNFFRKTNRLAEKTWLRRGLKWLGRPELESYYRDHYATVERGLEQWEQGERDLLFHGAPAAIVVAADKDASCPAEDALLATGNMLLGAHSLGLGTCLIGFVIEAMRRDNSITRSLGIPDSEIPCTVMAVGWPDEVYQQVAGRKSVMIRYA
ncbi:nitroreductase [Desulfosarcina widdelii]|uniref:Nitroreductase n=1 Tax=Desulfosarcina widdelii TaxID=947919 RepID=A0A5K7ZGE8_9BACT|nr:nitroreductase family protein [Desulfosarcina widdelii]BBO75177.1 nitroreductase [Desulfosarcina widdelii]